MKLETLNKVCFRICILCLILGVALTLTMIWAELGDRTIWKWWLTLATLFTGAALTLFISKTVHWMREDKADSPPPS